MRRGWFYILPTLAIGFVLLECKQPAPLRPQFVANFYSNLVSAYSIGSNGVLTPLPGSPFAGGQTHFSVSVDPTAKFAYVANRFGGNISAYSIGSNRALTPFQVRPLQRDMNPIQWQWTPQLSSSTRQTLVATTADRSNLSGFRGRLGND